VVPEPEDAPVTTPQQRDRDARAAAAVARACGFAQPVAPLIVRRIPAVETLLRRDDATIRRVLGDASLRSGLRQGVVDGFQATWKQATMDRLRDDHPVWLRRWWWPVCSAAEHARLLAAPAPRSDHRRVGIAVAAFPATVGAAEVLTDADHRRTVGDHLLVERRMATAVLDLAVELAAEADGPRPRGAGSGAIDDPPPGVAEEEARFTGWWHG
jgi:hypothetical protein